jgi:phosphate transport system ATP-binding protein
MTMSPAMPESTPTVSITAPGARKPSAHPENLVEKVSIRNLSFFYDQHKALKDIYLALHDKKVTAFIGPSIPTRRCAPGRRMRSWTRPTAACSASS